MRLLAPAKINLHLRVGPPRADGFHPILSWMVTVGLFDMLVLDQSPQDGIALTCDHPSLPLDTDNLVARAAGEFLARACVREGQSQSPPGISIRLLKRIPIGAGLGGGSSDGARILLGLNHLLRAGWSRERLSQLAGTLGSDLPFFMGPPSAICRGRGELVQPHSPPQTRFALLILPGRPLPTPAVYKMFDKLNLGSEDHLAEPDWDSWNPLSATQLLPRLINDLEPAAFAIDPELGRLRADLEQILARPVRMSGSGSSLFTLYDTSEQATAASEALTTVSAQIQAVPIVPPVLDDLNGLNEEG